ncbi:MAG: tetratricopeptide repeat protein [Melioribacteraceae bacterium]|jgi:TolA-binding protein|nr:tetratricopeptide repeat protein [Melioribacteraceae bacterium]
MNFLSKLLPILFILLIIAGCSSKDEKLMFDTADKLASEEKYIEAIKAFDELAAEFPKGDFTLKGNYTVGKIYHSLLVPDVPREESFNMAIKYYRKSVDGYPENKDAENALMMIGFIYANELNNVDSAKLTYEEFLKNYPKSELVNSVKLEYENIGLTPEQILEKRIGSIK